MAPKLYPSLVAFPHKGYTSGPGSKQFVALPHNASHCANKKGKNERKHKTDTRACCHLFLRISAGPHGHTSFACSCTCLPGGGGGGLVRFGHQIPPPPLTIGQKPPKGGGGDGGLQEGQFGGGWGRGVHAPKAKHWLPSPLMSSPPCFPPLSPNNGSPHLTPWGNRHHTTVT